MIPFFQTLGKRNGVCLKEMEGADTGGVVLSSALQVLSLNCPWNIQVDMARCVSYTYGKSSELELFNWILSVCRD